MVSCARASCSRLESYVEEFGRRLAVLEPLSEHVKRKRLNLGDDLGLVDAIRHNARKPRNLGDPSPVSLTFEFDLKRHKGTLAFDRRPADERPMV